MNRFFLIRVALLLSTFSPSLFLPFLKYTPVFYFEVLMVQQQSVAKKDIYNTFYLLNYPFESNFLNFASKFSRLIALKAIPSICLRSHWPVAHCTGKKNPPRESCALHVCNDLLGVLYFLSRLADSIAHTPSFCACGSAFYSKKHASAINPRWRLEKLANTSFAFAE